MTNRQVCRPLCVLTGALTCVKSVVDSAWHSELPLDVLLLASGLHGVEQEQGERQGLHFPTADISGPQTRHVIFHVKTSGGRRRLGCEILVRQVGKRLAPRLRQHSHPIPVQSGRRVRIRPANPKKKYDLESVDSDK